MYDESFDPQQRQGFNSPPHPPFATVFSLVRSCTYRTSYREIRPPERETDHAELVPKLRRHGVLPLLAMVRVYKVYITTLTYKL